MARREMSRWKKALYIFLAMLVLGVIIGAILYLRANRPPEPKPSPSPTPSETPRGLTNEKFGNRARPLSAANVDVGILTVRRSSAKPSPKFGRGGSTQSLGEIAQLAPPDRRQYTDSPRRTPTPLPSLAPTPEPPPVFTVLPDAPAPGEREFALVYAKGDVGKRQIYLRAVERDEDELLVSSVFDDYGVAFSSATQKVAFYSNEEGASDETTNRTKLKAVDIASRKVTTVAKALPGTWPAVWSPDGKQLAIPAERSLFVADITTGKSIRINTGRTPGGVVWSPDGIHLYYQAESEQGDNDLYQANVITKDDETLVKTENNEHDLAVSVDGKRISYLQGQGAGGEILVVQTLEDQNPKLFTETRPASSFLMNRNLTLTVLVRGDQDPRLGVFANGKITEIGQLKHPVLVGWDRDYEHVLVMADDDRGRALFSVKIANGEAQKLKAGVSDTVPISER